MTPGEWPSAAPTPSSAPPAPHGTLNYASAASMERVGQSGFGLASLVLCGVTVIYCTVCAVRMSGAREWDGLAWLAFGLIGNWIGCGLAVLLALAGVVQRKRGRRLSVHALWISLVLGLGPISLIWVAAVL